MARIRTLLALGAVLVALGAAELVACSASQERGTQTGSGADPTGGAGTDATGGAGGGIITTTTDTGGVGGSCVGDTFAADPIPLDMFVMLDQSGSMLSDAGNGSSRWTTVQQAITAFVQQPDLTGLGMGLQYFGLPQPLVPGCSAMACVVDTDCINGCGPCNTTSGVCLAPFNPDIDSCDGIDYAWAEVPIQPLPGVANAITGSISMHSPGTNTPTMPAIDGAIMYAKAWAIAHPGQATVVGFATDGGPAVCDTDLNNINAVIAAGYNGTPSIKTFVIGVGPLLSALDGFAAAGGTTAAIHVDTNPNATQDFLAALNTIRNGAFPCTYQIPPPPQGMTIDFNQVNVIYTPGYGPEETIPKVMSEGACPINGMGWYYDNESAPTQIILCDATCAAIQADVMGEVRIMLGCATILR